MPGINDGEVLEDTLTELEKLSPACASVAVVPVGVTKFREKLEHLDTYDKEGSRKVIQTVEHFQKRFLSETGSRIVFLSDEWYLNAELPIPPEEYYEDFGQIENGVGMLRLFAMEFEGALADKAPLSEWKKFSMAGGTAAASFFNQLYHKLDAYRIEWTLYPIPNRYFGGNVHVGGLVTGSDLVAELSDKLLEKVLLIPRNMLKEREDVFLDGMTVKELEETLHVKVVAVKDGADLVEKVFEVET